MRFQQKTKMKSSTAHLSMIGNKKGTKSKMTTNPVAHGIAVSEEPWGKNQLIVGSYMTEVNEDDIIYKPVFYSTQKKNKTSRVIKAINKIVIGKP